MSARADQPPPGASTQARLVVLWSRPEDQDTFDTHYVNEHMPMASKLPGLLRVSSSRVSAHDYYRLAELTFASRDNLNAAIASPAGKTLAADAATLEERFGVTSTSIVVLAADILKGDDHETA